MLSTERQPSGEGGIASVRVTLKDIAQRAGVSMMTVSNVINGNSARVSPATIERIQRIVVELGYVPSHSARSLAAKSSRMVGVLVPAADEESLTISPHNVAIIGQLERELRKRAYDVLLRGIARPGRSRRRCGPGTWTAPCCSASSTRRSARSRRPRPAAPASWRWTATRTTR